MLALCLWSAVFAIYPGPPSHASGASANLAPDADEFELKAAFLFNFMRYASWPKGTFPKPNSPIVVAIVGEDAYSKKLKTVIKGRKAGKRPIIIRHYRKASDIKGSHIAILGKMSTTERQAAVKRLKKDGSLIVADRGGTEATGASLGFFTEGKKVRFEVHARNLKASKIRLGSQVLKLAKIVGRKPKR